MEIGTKPSLSEEIAAALDWWRDAGVDCDLRDEAQGWILEKEAEPASKAAPAPAASARPAADAPLAAPVIDRSTWPADLAAFPAWWLSDPVLDEGQTAGRVPPRGVPGAELMIVVAEPERNDSAELLSGPQGKLLNAMLAAMGIAPEAAYFASALPRHTPHADWAAAKRRGIGEVLRHHIALAAPKRLIVFGGNILPLLGHDPANSPANSREFNHGDRSVPLLLGRELGALLERPRWKAGFWQSWLEWTSSNMGTGNRV